MADSDCTPTPDEPQGRNPKPAKVPIHDVVEDAATHVLEGVPTPKTTRRRLIRLGFELGAIVLAIYLVVPLLPAFRRTAEELVGGQPWLLLILIPLMVGVQLAYGELVCTVLHSMGEDPPFWLIQRTTVVGTSIGKVLPAGTTVALVLIVATLRKIGMDGSRATVGLASAGMISSVVLVVMFPIGVALALVGGQTGGLVLTALIAAGIVVAVAASARSALKRSDPIAEWIGNFARHFDRGPLHGRIKPDEITAALKRGSAGVLDLTADMRAVGRAGGWAAANWLLDFSAMVLIAMTIGRGTPLAGLLLAYVLGQLATALPITPGGIGVVEVVMVGYLTATGSPTAAATATVLGWRLVSHWLPIPVGLSLLPGLRRQAERYSVGAAPPAPEPT